MSTQQLQIVNERIRVAMARKLVNQTAMAKAIGLDNGTMSLRMRGLREWRVTEVMTLASHLECSAGYLLGEGEL